MSLLKKPLLAGVFVCSLLTACDAPSLEEQRDAEASERVSRELREWDEVQRIWRAKEKQGQGCEGEVLVGGALRDVVVGKQHIVAWGGVVPDPSRGASEWRNYHSDGTLISSLSSSLYEAEYEIAGSLLCSRVFLPSVPVEACFRLIRSPDGKVFEERLALPGVAAEVARGQDLACVELQIKEIGASG